MAEALRDQNHIPTLLAASNADGVTTLPVYADPISHVLSGSNGTGGVDLSDEPGQRDENHVVVLMAVSAVDGVTPVPIYATSMGNKLLIRTT
jgi:hypothetical protein